MYILAAVIPQSSSSSDLTVGLGGTVVAPGPADAVEVEVESTSARAASRAACALLSPGKFMLGLCFFIGLPTEGSSTRLLLSAWAAGPESLPNSVFIPGAGAATLLLNGFIDVAGRVIPLPAALSGSAECALFSCSTVS
jgi:hypothetical protein